MNGKTAKIIAILAACVLTLVIYLFPKKTMLDTNPAVVELPSLHSEDYFSELEEHQEANLDQKEKEKLAGWKQLVSESGSKRTDLYDSISSIWDTHKLFSLSAFWYEQKAKKDGTEKSYLNAAYRYFDARKQSVDTSVKRMITEKTIAAYNKVLDLNPENLNAKSDLGVLYTEDGSNPMKGIKMLQEVVAADPDHEMAQLNLGLLAYRSNQLDKALERFDKVLQINPDRIDMHIYKSQVYREQGKSSKAIDEIEKFITSAKNPEMINEAVKMIDEIKGEAK